jgi:hypothetical protein
VFSFVFVTLRLCFLCSTAKCASFHASSSVWGVFLMQGSSTDSVLLSIFQCLEVFLAPGCSTAGCIPSILQNYLVFGRFLLLRCSAASILPFLKPQNCASFHLVVFPSLLMFVVRQKLCLLQLSIIQSRSMGRNCLLRMSDFH